MCSRRRWRVPRPQSSRSRQHRPQWNQPHPSASSLPRSRFRRRPQPSRCRSLLPRLRPLRFRQLRMSPRTPRSAGSVRSHRHETRLSGSLRRPVSRLPWLPWIQSRPADHRSVHHPLRRRAPRRRVDGRVFHRLSLGRHDRGSTRCYAQRLAPIVQGTRTPPFQGGNRGSNPLGGTTLAPAEEHVRGARLLTTGRRISATAPLPREFLRLPGEMTTHAIASGYDGARLLAQGANSEASQRGKQCRFERMRWMGWSARPS